MKIQQITLGILLLFSVFLVFEFMRKQEAEKEAIARKIKEAKAEIKSKADSSQKKAKISVADSIASTYVSTAFRREQKRFPRVRAAYKAKADSIKKLLKFHKIDEKKLSIYLRAFKEEKLLEVWARDKENTPFKLIRTYSFCATSGSLGPKRREGDGQIPEGFYRLDRFNPKSQFHLSLGVNYPNRSDQVLGDTTNIGGEIYLHGGCATTGCIPITDDKIKELYVLCIDAKAAGQKRIPLTIFPAKLTEGKYRELLEKYSEHPEWFNLWEALRKGYQYFEDCRLLPVVIFGEDGSLSCRTSCKP